MLVTGEVLRCCHVVPENESQFNTSNSENLSWLTLNYSSDPNELVS